MSHGVKVAKNTLILIVAEPARRLISLATVMLVARYLSVDDFGMYQFGMAIVSIVAVLAAFGTNAFVIREIAKDHHAAARLVGAVFSARITMYLITAALLAGGVWLRGYSPVKFQVILLVALGLLFTDMEDVCVSIFDGFQRMEFGALVAIFHAAVTLAAVVVVRAMHWDVRAMAAAYNASHFASLCFALVLVGRYFTPLHLDFRVKTFLQVAKAGWPFLTINILWITSFYIDKVMLGEMIDDKSVGYYGAAYRLYEVMIAVPILVGRALYPAFSAQVGAGDVDGMRQLFGRSIRIMAMIALPMCVGTILTGTPFIVLLFGAKYAPSGLTLSILGGILWMFFLSTSGGWALTAMNRLGWIFTANAIATTVNIAANLVLIPRYSFNGAAVVTGLSQLVLTICYIALTQKELHVFHWNLVPWRPAIAVAVMGIGLYGGLHLLAASTPLVQILVLVPAAAVLYVAGLFATGSLQEADREMLRTVTARFRRTGAA